MRRIPRERRCYRGRPVELEKISGSMSMESLRGPRLSQTPSDLCHVSACKACLSSKRFLTRGLGARQEVGVPQPREAQPREARSPDPYDGRSQDETPSLVGTEPRSMCAPFRKEWPPCILAPLECHVGGQGMPVRRPEKRDLTSHRRACRKRAPLLGSRQRYEARRSTPSDELLLPRPLPGALTSVVLSRPLIRRGQGSWRPSLLRAGTAACGLRIQRLSPSRARHLRARRLTCQS
jgi:hypothetical protein